MGGRDAWLLTKKSKQLGYLAEEKGKYSGESLDIKSRVRKTLFITLFKPHNYTE